MYYELLVVHNVIVRLITPPLTHICVYMGCPRSIRVSRHLQAKNDMRESAGRSYIAVHVGYSITVCMISHIQLQE